MVICCPVHLVSEALNVIECCAFAYVYAIFAPLAMPVSELNVAAKCLIIRRIAGPPCGIRRIHFLPQSSVAGRIIGAFMDLLQKANYIFMKDRATIRSRVIVPLSSILLIFSNTKNGDDSVPYKASQAFGCKDDDGSYFDFRGFRVSQEGSRIQARNGRFHTPCAIEPGREVRPRRRSSSWSGLRNGSWSGSGLYPTTGYRRRQKLVQRGVRGSGRGSRSGRREKPGLTGTPYDQDYRLFPLVAALVNPVIGEDSPAGIDHLPAQPAFLVAELQEPGESA